MHEASKTVAFISSAQRRTFRLCRSGNNQTEPVLPYSAVRPHVHFSLPELGGYIVLSGTSRESVLSTPSSVETEAVARVAMSG